MHSSTSLTHIVLLFGTLSSTCVYSRAFTGPQQRTVEFLEEITPQDSLTTALKAADHTNKGNPPVPDTVVSMFKRDGNDSSVALCDSDEDWPECQPPPQDYCDWSLSFRDLDALATANLTGSCADILAMRTLLNLLDGSVANHNKTNNGYDAATGVTQLARMAALVGIAGNTGLGIIEIIENPTSAPMAILGILLVAADFRNPVGFAEMGATRRGMGTEDVMETGSSFEANSDKLAIAVNKAGKVR